MILFFRTPAQHLYAVQSNSPLKVDDVRKLEWLFSDATLLETSSVTGNYIGPRREMITPWSTNAVEITQNMGISGILRIEEYRLMPYTHHPCREVWNTTRCWSVFIRV